MSLPYSPNPERAVVMQPSDKISISGIGIVSPLGERVSENRDALEKDARTQLFRITSFKASDYITRRYLRPLDDVTIRCIAMAAEAMRDAGVDNEALDPAQIGVVVGSMYAGIGCIFNFKQTCYEGRENGYVGLSPLYFPGIVFNSLSGQPAIEFGYTGPNAVVNGGFSSGLLAVIKGIEYIRSGKADVVIAGGAEMSHPFIREKYEIRKSDPRLTALGPDFTLSEAVCLFVLHREDDPRFTKKFRYATVSGWRYGFLPKGCSKSGLAGAMKAIPNLRRDALDAVVMSGYKNSPLYLCEKDAVDEVFSSDSPVLLNNKNNFGHTLGASGSLNLFHGLLALKSEAGRSGMTLINALDPNGNFAFLTLQREENHD